MTPAERLKKAKAYAKARLKKEIDDGRRGTSARLARVLDTTTAHVSNLRNRSALPGEEMLPKLAAHWEMSLDELISLACGDPVGLTTTTSDRVHPTILRVGQLGGFSDDEIAAANAMVRALAGTATMGEDVATDLLTRARLAIGDGAREAASRLQATVVNSDDDLSVGLASLPKSTERKR